MEVALGVRSPRLESQGGALCGPGKTCGSASWDLEVTEGMSQVAEPRLSQAPCFLPCVMTLPSSQPVPLRAF